MDRSIGSPSGGRLYHGRLPARVVADQCWGIRVEQAHSSNQPCDAANGEWNNGLEGPQRPPGVGARRRASESPLRFLGPRDLAPTCDSHPCHRAPSVIPLALSVFCEVSKARSCCPNAFARRVRERDRSATATPTDPLAG